MALVKENNEIKALEAEFEKGRVKIQNLRNSRKNGNDFSPEDKKVLRSEYSNLAHIAKKLSMLYKDEKQAKEMLALYKTLVEQAQLYGSVMTPKEPKISFADVCGLDNVKALVESFVFMLENPELVKYYKIEGGLGMLM